MTDDLVKRLRDKNCCDASHCNCDEAADQIEELEAALRKIFAVEDEHINAPKNHQEAVLWVTLAACVGIAEAALAGEKKDGEI